MKVFKQLKSGKAAGLDNIPAEALKADVEIPVDMLQLLFKKIWEEEQLPSERKEGYLIKIIKKETSSNAQTTEISPYC